MKGKYMAFTSNHSDLKRINRLAIINLVKKQPSLSRVDLTEFTKLNKSTVSKLVQELILEKWIIEDDIPTSLEGAGRPPTGLSINGNVLALLGAEIGVDTLTVLACSITGDVLFNASLSYQHLSFEDTFTRLTDLLLNAAQVITINQHEILGIGVSTHGMVHFEQQSIILAPNLGWKNIPIRERMLARFADTPLADKPITIVNDCQAGALSEFVFGQMQHQRRPMVYVHLGIGVGAGIVTEHGLYHGDLGWAGEIGHSILQMTDGVLCGCGQRGCVETLVSQRALSRLAGSTGVLPIAQLLRRHERGDLLVRDGLNAIAQYLGVVLRNMVNMINPRTIVIGGSMSQFGNALLEPTIDSLKQHTGHNYDIPNVQLCQFGEQAGALGAAGAALNQYIEPQSMPVHLVHTGLLR
ncbi:MAG: ROK family transcriptional regulator [Formosimonas sp.]